MSCLEMPLIIILAYFKEKLGVGVLETSRLPFIRFDSHRGSPLIYLCVYNLHLFVFSSLFLMSEDNQGSSSTLGNSKPKTQRSCYLS